MERTLSLAAVILSVVISGCLGGPAAEPVDSASAAVPAAPELPPLPDPILDTKRVQAGLDPFNLAQRGICSQEVSTCFRYPFLLERPALVLGDLAWGLEANDFDFYIVDEQGEQAANGANDVTGGPTILESFGVDLKPGTYEVVVVAWLVAEDAYSLRVTFEPPPLADLTGLMGIGDDPLPGVPGRVTRRGCTSGYHVFPVPRSLVEHTIPPGFKLASYLPPGESVEFASVTIAAVSCDTIAGSGFAAERFSEAFLSIKVIPPEEYREEARSDAIVAAWVTDHDGWRGVLASWGAAGLGAGSAEILEAPGPGLPLRQTRIVTDAFTIELEIGYLGSAAGGGSFTWPWRMFFVEDRRLTGAFDLLLRWTPTPPIGPTVMTSRGDASMFLQTSEFPAGAGASRDIPPGGEEADLVHVPLHALHKPGRW